MKESDWVFRPLAEANIEEVLGLLAGSLSNSGATMKSREFWRWKHELNWFGVSKGSIALDSNGETVGVRPFMQWRLSVGKSESIPALRPVDTVTHPDYRGRGLFSTLALRTLDTMRPPFLVFNTPNNNSFPGYRKLGWRVAARIPVLVCVLKPLRGAARYIFRRGVAAQLPGWQGVSAGRTISWCAYRNRCQLYDFIETCEQKRGFYGYRTPRDRHFMEWRYGQQPNVDYGVFACQGEAGLLSGVVVLRLERRNGLLGALVVDIFVEGARDDVVCEVLRKLKLDLDVDYLVASIARHSPEAEGFSRAFFFASHKSIDLAVLCRGLEERLDPFALDSWDFTLNELEIF